MKKIDAFLPNMIWNIDHYKKKNLYFYLMEMTNVQPDSAHVMVEGYGDMLLFGSYSYLGLIGHPRIQQAAYEALQKYGTGTHGVRLLAGTLPIHNQLEAKISEFKNTEAAITFSSGYVTNVSTISCLLEEGDVVICDKLDHSSIIDGCSLSKAEFVRFRHNDMNHLEHNLIKMHSRHRKLVVVDAVFSMDGDIINLPIVKELCDKYGALLMVDEAHSTGVLGRTGHGIEEYFNLSNETIDIKMGTLSKAIPSVGGYIAGSEKLISFLKHTARGFIYSASLPAPSAAAALTAFEIIEEEPSRVKALSDNYNYLLAELRSNSFSVLNSQTAIVPIICGTIDKSVSLVKHCMKNGIFIQAVYPPVVPMGTARLRAIVTSSHTKNDIDYFLEILKRGTEDTNLL